MLRFECDYSEGAHPRILQRLLETNNDQTPGYGEDDYCDTARKIIRLACGDENMDVHFLVGGTQANATVIASALRPYQGVICAETGHIASHETGAIEATGHKVLPIPSENGKISALQVKALVEAHWNDSTHEHMPQPAMVYISQPTETGLVYTKRELEELRRICTRLGLYLFADGARLGYALASDSCDLYLSDMARLCDVFYIGGTKVGAMFGEAVCITNKTLKTDFRYNMKQRGAMLAKGRFLGLQFDVLLRDGLYLQISKKAVSQAMRIKEAFQSSGCHFLYDSPTNQQFPIVNSMVLTELSKNYSFALWQKMSGDFTAIRFVTSWATADSAVDSLVNDIKRICRLYGEKTPSWSVELPE